MNMSHSGNFNPRVGVFLMTVNLFDLDIMATRNSHVDKEAFFLFNDGDVWFGDLKDAVCLDVKIIEDLDLVVFDHLSLVVGKLLLLLLFLVLLMMLILFLFKC